MNKGLHFLICAPCRFCNTASKNAAAQKLQFRTLTLRNDAFTRIINYTLGHCVFLFTYVCTHTFAISKLNIKLVTLQRAESQN